MHVMQNNAKLDVILFQPGESIGGLRTYGAFIHDTWRASNRLTFNLGVRFDRYRAYSPEQGHPTSRFNPTAQTFAAVDNYISWNLPAPRLGMTYDVSGNGKTVLKANYGTYWWNPGADFVFNISPNASAWWRRYRWTDTNNDNRWQPGEEGAQTDARGGSATESLDPNLEGHLHQGVRDVRRARADAQLRRARRLRVARPAQPVRPLQHQPAVLARSPCRSRSPIRDRTARVGNADDGAPLQAIRPGAGIPRPADRQSADQRRRQRRRLPHLRNHRHQAHEQPLEPAGVVRLDQELRPGRHDPGQRDSRQRAAGDSERQDQHRGWAAGLHAARPSS